MEKVPLGKPPVLEQQNEERLVNHIRKLQEAGFAPSSIYVRQMTFNYAKKLNVAERLT